MTRLSADQQALVEAHLGFAAELAAEPKYRRWGLSYRDLLQEARLGLCRAAGSFDQGRHPGMEFAAWARKYVIGSMWKAITRNLGKLPTEDGSNDEEDSFEGIEGIEATDFDEHASRLESEVQDALDTLTPHDRQLIIQRFGLGDDDPMGPIELSEFYGCTARRIRQRLEQARNRLGTELERRGWAEAKARESFAISRAMPA